MRVTERMMTDTVLQNISANLARMQAAQNEVSSGQRIRRPSDDPVDLAQALGYQSAIARADRYVNTIDTATAWLNATDAALGSTTDLLVNARQLAVQGANDTLSSDQRAVLAKQVDQILEQLVSTANSSFQGQRLFAGLKTDVDPFALTAGPPTTVTYNGDSGSMGREIQTGTVVDINTQGNAVFPAGFNALIGLRESLLADDVSGIRANGLTALDSAMSDVAEAQTEVGARVNRFQAVRDQQDQLRQSLTVLKGKLTDTDYAQAITNFSAQETVYQASLAAAARTLQGSLFDFLR